jgi:mono/diheme cytochrome c family protein
VAVLLGLLLSASVLWHETTQRAAAQAAATAQPAAAALPASAAAQPTAALPASAAAQPTAAAPTATAAPTAARATAPATAAPTQVAAAAVATATPVPAKPAVASAGSAGSAGSAAEGSKIFAATCNSCHPNANAGLGPSLKGVSADMITKTVREGKDMMPSFGPDEVSDQQLQDIVAYLTSLR